MKEQSSNGNLIQRGIAAASKVVENLQFAAPLLTRLVIGVTFFYSKRQRNPS